MARITYLGEGINPPPSLDWRGVTFPLGQAVEVKDPAIIAKAKTAPSIFKVEELASAGDPPQPEPQPVPKPPPPAPAPDDNDNDDEDDDEKPRGHAATHRRHAPAPAPRKKK